MRLRAILTTAAAAATAAALLAVPAVSASAATQSRAAGTIRTATASTIVTAPVGSSQLLTATITTGTHITVNGRKATATALKAGQRVTLFLHTGISTHLCIGTSCTPPTYIADVITASDGLLYSGSVATVSLSKVVVAWTTAGVRHTITAAPTGTTVITVDNRPARLSAVHVGMPAIVAVRSTLGSQPCTAAGCPPARLVLTSIAASSR